MPRASRIFISHSANTIEEPATQKFLDALVRKLQTCEGLEPLTDQKDLKAGDLWLQKLYAWMGLCDAAVILLSPRAVTRENSAWVPREANLLMWRKALDPRFTILPVLIGGLKPSDLAGNPFLADLRLNEVQLADGLSDAQKIKKIAEVLTARVGPAARPATFEPVRVHVEDCLQRYAPDASVQEALLQHYGQDSWQPYTAPHQNLALKMVRHAAHKEVDQVITDVTACSQGSDKLGSRLFEALYPLRMPAEPACTLHSLILQQEGKGAVLVNSKDNWPVQMLMRSATGLLRDPFLRTWRFIELPEGWGDDDQREITLYLAQELAEAALGTGGWELLSDHPDPQTRQAEQMAVLREQLAEARQETKAPIVVCARFSARWAELAGGLAAQFPTTVFLFWAGDTLEQAAHAAQANLDCMALNPTWPNGADRLWQLNYQRKLTQLGGTSP